MKKILHIQVLPKLSGVQKISLEIFRKLPDREYDKWILFSAESEGGCEEECIKQFEAAGVKIILSKNLRRSIGWRDIFAFLEIYRLCRMEKFDIVHTHSTKPGIVGRIAATCARVPLIVHTVHGLAFHKFIKFPLWQFYWICEMFASIFCDKIILVNKYYINYFRWFRRKTLTIYNGIDFSVFSGMNTEVSYKLTSCIKVLFVGRLDIQKDPITLLKAWRIVYTKYPGTQFTMVGDGEKYQECKEFIINNDLSDNVVLTGWSGDVAGYYASHDIFAMSSIYESFGLIFLEAGYYKLPVVATNVEGIPEVVEHEKTGLLSKPLDADTLAQNIIRLIEDDVLRHQMGLAGYQRVKMKFSSARMVKEYLDIY